MYFWLHWVFVAACGLSLVAVSRGYSSLRVCGLPVVEAALVVGAQTLLREWASVVAARGSVVVA